jgi:hypothetical protein
MHIIKDQNVELQISHKRMQIHLAYRQKKLIDPADSNFGMKKANRETVQMKEKII